MLTIQVLLYDLIGQRIGEAHATIGRYDLTQSSDIEEKAQTDRHVQR